MVLPQVVGLSEDELDGLVLAVAPQSEVEPVLGVVVVGDVGVALDFDGERVVIEDAGAVEVAAGEAAVCDEVLAEVDEGAVGVPLLFCLREGGLHAITL